MDDAFFRRFQSIIHFPAPGKNERRLLWERATRGIPANVDDSFIDGLSVNYELTGANIINVVQFVALRAKSSECEMSAEDLLHGIKRELQKEGKVI